MADINGVPKRTHQSNYTLEDLFAALDPKSLILSQNSTSLRSNPLQFTPANLTLQRGPRYKAYAELRESKLRMKNQQQYDEPESTLTPPKKRVTFQRTGLVCGRKGTSIVARSVPDSNAALKKENRRLVSSMLEMTPPPSKVSKVSRLGGSKSVNGGEKRGGEGGLMVRKSCVSMKEFPGLSLSFASAFNGEGRGGSSGRGINNTGLGSRRYGS